MRVRQRAHILVLMVFLAASAAMAGAATLPNGDLQIVKKEVSPKARFYTAVVDGVKVEILALRAPDGTVRTAFNTCQVCYNSGRGYYVQQGDVLVCQNCGNRFKASQVEVVKGGCNPVPIFADQKKENTDTITISRQLLEEARFLFVKRKAR